MKNLTPLEDAMLEAMKNCLGLLNQRVLGLESYGRAKRYLVEAIDRAEKVAWGCSKGLHIHDCNCPKRNVAA